MPSAGLSARRLAGWSFIGLGLWLAPVAGAVEPDDPVARGREIYRRGVSPSDVEITALMGDDQIEVPAAALPCANCHGLDGRGRPEGGVSPSDLTWPALTRPYEVRHASGRRRPPYDEKRLGRAITLGLDSAGNALHVAMPRYRMAREDLSALLAYLRTIADDGDPGVSDRRVVLGQLLPPGGGFESVERVQLRVVEDELRRVNEAGGVYGRELQLATLVLPADPAERAEAVERFVEDESIFAFAPSFLAGADRELAALAGRLEVPLVAPLSLAGEDSFPVNRHVFYLWSGLAGQARALARHSRRSAEPSPSPRVAAVVFPPGGRASAAVAAIGDEIGADREILRVAMDPSTAPPAEVARRLAAGGVTDLFLLETGPTGVGVLAAAGDIGWSPRVLVPGSLVGGALLAAARDLGSVLWIAYPTLPGDQSASAAAELASRLEETGLSAGDRTLATRVAAGTRLLIEGLERAGRELSRERLIGALEGLYDHPTGLTRPLTFGPNRRVGARGSYVIAVGGAESNGSRDAGWVPVDQ